MTIDPFQLLGVDPHKTTMKDLKKCYYNLALLVHPDKSNAPNASQEMDVLYKAYLYCKEQIENSESRGTTYEQLEKDFEEFCKVQESVAPPFRDIVEDVLEMAKFNQEFNTAAKFAASFADGYGDLMETSQYASTNSTERTEAVDYVATEAASTSLKNDFSSLVVYTEPIPLMKHDGDYFDYQRKLPMDSYTVYVKDLCLTDYKEANSAPEPIDYTIKEKSFEQILQERKVMDDQIAKTATTSCLTDELL
jgi:DnaJ domain